MSDIVVVHEPEYDVVVNVDSHDVVVSDEGEQGPPGPQGPPGASVASYTQAFTNTNFVTVTHNLGFKANTQIIVAGEEIEGVDINHISINQLTVGWNGNLTGEVVCS